MRKICRLFPVIAVFLSGCMEISQNIVVDQAGSGHIELYCIIPERTIVQFKAMRKLQAEMEKAAGKDVLRNSAADGETFALEKRLYRNLGLLMDGVEEQIRSRLSVYRKDGISVDHLKISVRNASRHIRLKLHFTDIAKAAQTELFRTHWPLDLVKTDDGNYLLRNSVRLGSEPGPSEPPDDKELKSVEPVFLGFKARFKISVPGDILKAGTNRKSKRSAVWLYDFNSDSRAFYAFQRGEMNVLFDGEGLGLPVTVQEKENQ